MLKSAFETKCAMATWTQPGDLLNSMHQTSRRFLLKERTALAHRRVDEKVGLFDTIPSYSAYLQGLFLFRRPIERVLEGVKWPAAMGTWRPTLIAGEIAADLSTLGLNADCDRDRHCGFDGDSSLFGCLYVLEGSVFGARVLLKQALALGLDETHGARHLARQASSQSWTAFASALESAEGLDIEAATAAAIDTFAAAELAFARP